MSFCAKCKELHHKLAEARRVHDGSAATDAVVLLRRHERAVHGKHHTGNTQAT
ncbi:hypothetical protein [Streptomyces sp. HNM0574]|uniref:hypothetical protein n=1 Tax=Streptomyces sp. HNM0574 TaxID=2714954 RepID=UPI00146E4B5F|nr:hypothetical protein [Streptomyces sp. HNM0574]NLU67740.1 hypothetical protein [Streptomyces sp. HNM0574]